MMAAKRDSDCAHISTIWQRLNDSERLDEIRSPMLTRPRSEIAASRPARRSIMQRARRATLSRSALYEIDSVDIEHGHPDDVRAKLAFEASNRRFAKSIEDAITFLWLSNFREPRQHAKAFVEHFIADQRRRYRKNKIPGAIEDAMCAMFRAETLDHPQFTVLGLPPARAAGDVDEGGTLADGDDPNWQCKASLTLPIDETDTVVADPTNALLAAATANETVNGEKAQTGFLMSNVAAPWSRDSYRFPIAYVAPDTESVYIAAKTLWRSSLAKLEADSTVAGTVISDAHQAVEAYELRLTNPQSAAAERHDVLRRRLPRATLAARRRRR